MKINLLNFKTNLKIKIIKILIVKQKINITIIKWNIKKN